MSFEGRLSGRSQRSVRSHIIHGKQADTVGEVTARRQTQSALCIMVEFVRVEVLFFSNLVSCCEQSFPQQFCFGDFANSIQADTVGEVGGTLPKASRLMPSAMGLSAASHPASAQPDDFANGIQAVGVG